MDQFHLWREYKITPQWGESDEELHCDTPLSLPGDIFDKVRGEIEREREIQKDFSFNTHRGSGFLKLRPRWRARKLFPFCVCVREREVNIILCTFKHTHIAGVELKLTSFFFNLAQDTEESWLHSVTIQGMFPFMYIYK